MTKAELETVIKQQAKEIEDAKAEIAELKRKEGLRREYMYVISASIEKYHQMLSSKVDKMMEV